MVAATFENTLPLTVGGKEADYRKDDSGKVSHAKVNNGATNATKTYNFNVGTLFSAENWNNFLAEYQKQGQDVTENRTLTAEQRNQIGSTNSNPIVRFFANRQLDAMTQQA